MKTYKIIYKEVYTATYIVKDTSSENAKKQIYDEGIDAETIEYDHTLDDCEIIEIK